MPYPALASHAASIASSDAVPLCGQPKSVVASPSLITIMALPLESLRPMSLRLNFADLLPLTRRTATTLSPCLKRLPLTLFPLLFHSAPSCACEVQPQAH